MTSAYQRVNLPPDGLTHVTPPYVNTLKDDSSPVIFGTTIDIENQTINFYCDGTSFYSILTSLLII